MSVINLLIVEDERIIAMDLKSQLESLGYAVCKVVANGEDAIRAAAEFHPDLVLMDIHIEGPMDGIDTANQIGDRFSIPVVFLSAYSEDDVIRRAQSTQSFGFLVKPFERRELHATIQIAVERSRTEAALRLSRKTLAQEKSKIEAILSSIGDGLIVVDTQLQCIIFNSEALRVFGEAAQHIPLSSWVATLHISKPDGSPLAIDELPFIRAAKGQSFIRTEIMVYGESNSNPIQLRTTGRPFMSGDGTLLGGVTVFNDVTRERELDRLKDEFVSVASHELRTPMSAIKGITSMMLDGDFGALQDQMREPVTDIYKSTERLIDLVNDLLDAHRLNTGTMTFKLESVDLAALAGEVIRELQPLAARNNLQLTFSCAGDLAPAQADPNRVREILHNLIGNALKFTAKGSVSLELLDQGSQLMVRVSDTGIGISSVDQQRLFGKFQQISHQKIGKPSGSGLGLHIALTMVRRLGGELWLERSVPGQGSVFTFTLPKAGTEMAQQVKRALEMVSKPAETPS